MCPLSARLNFLRTARYASWLRLTGASEEGGRDMDHNAVLGVAIAFPFAIAYVCMAIVLVLNSRDEDSDLIATYGPETTGEEEGR